MPINARLSDCIAPAFYNVHWDIEAGKHTYYVLYGGRGSAKSSDASIEIVLGVMQDPDANAIVFRKYGNTIGTSVYSQIMWAIDKLGVTDFWKCNKHPHQCTYKPTGQVILFRGLDDPRKLKSVKVPRGYLKFAWFEELDEYAGDEEIRSVQQSILRGGPKYVVFKTFNPPISKTNWANKYVLTPHSRTLFHKSCYLDVPRDWLGDDFIYDAEDLKETNPRAYEHEYLGEAVGTGGEVFDNLEIREIPDEEINTFWEIYQGLDFGFWPDPAQWIKCCYNPKQSAAYIFDEYRAYRTSNFDLWTALTEQKGVTSDDLIIADSAEPKSIGDFRAYGANMRGAIKGPESRNYSHKWAQSLKKIVIDPVRCPNAAKEFTEYEYQKDKNGDTISGYPDGADHCVDSFLYALNSVWKRRGQ